MKLPPSVQRLAGGAHSHPLLGLVFVRWLGMAVAFVQQEYGEERGTLVSKHARGCTVLWLL